ncbi:MAG: alpha-E domain-containing protein [Opitutales bacterium]|nr:alpha-E domain-containing protein [Opitutales bacterium]
MLSRVADSLYWMGRYIERAENTARLLDVNLQLLIDFSGFPEEDTASFWSAVVESCGDMDLFKELYDEATSETVTDFLTFNLGNGNSILASVFAARENARMIRDQISLEMWECINELYHYVREGASSEVWRTDVYDFFEQVKSYSHRFQGLTEATFVHDEGFTYLQLGKYLERADQTSRIMDLKYFMILPPGAEVGGEVDIAGWIAVLRSCSGLDAFHRQYVGEVQARNVAEFLVLSRPFPRSMRFCLRLIDQNIRAIAGTPEGLFTNEPEQLAGRLRSEVVYTSVDEIIREGLHQYLDRLQRRLIDIHQSLYRTFFELPQIDIAEEIQHQQAQMQQ